MMLPRADVQEIVRSRFQKWTSQPLQAFDSHLGGFEAALLFALLLPAIRRLTRIYMYEPLGNRALGHRLKGVDGEKGTTMHKWNESCWKATFYTCVVAVGTLTAWRERFVRDTRYFWIGCSRFPPCNYEVPLFMRLMYSLELGFYVQAVPYLLFWEVRRKDFWESLAHHLATIGLITYSYEVNFMKIGTMVFLCHDVNDIFMELAKLCKYAEREVPATGFFVLFVLSWFGSRMVYFPLWVIRSAWTEPLTIIADVYHIDPHPHHEIFLSLLCFLFALHCYWSYLILRIVFRQFTRGDLQDVREKDD